MTTLAISFVNPALLWFGALAALPVLIYLFNRQRYRTMKWAAMDFVLRAVKANRSRLRVENLLLLLLRITAVTLVVLALARPVMKPFGPLGDLAEKRSHVVIVLDSSFSMGFRQGARSSFERAQKAAHDLAEAILKPGDKLAIMAVADAPRALYADPIFVDETTKARVLRDILEVEVSAQPGDATRALSAVASYLPRFERPGTTAPPGGAPEGGAVSTVPKTIYFFTDLQRSGFATERGLRDPNLRRAASELARVKAELVLVDCGTEDASNLAVTRLEAADDLAGVDIPIKVTASVKNFGPAAAHDLTLEFFVDDTLQGSPPLSLEAGEEREVERYVIFRDRGAHKVQVVLKSDGLAVDNARALALDAREAIDVVMVDGDQRPDFGDGETDFLGVALAPAEEGKSARDYLLRPAAVPETAIAEQDLSRGPVLALANVAALTTEQVERLESFVRAGGGLLVFLGPHVDAASWNERAFRDGKGFFPARLAEVVSRPEEERYFVLAADTFHHPVLRPFAGKDGRPLFAKPRFTSYWRLSWPENAIDDPQLSALAWFEERRATVAGESAAETAASGAGAGSARDPALVEKRFGRGRVLLFTSTADGEWNNFFAQYAYLMLWQKAAVYLADAGTGRKNLLAGEAYEAIVPSSEYSSEILLTTPAQDQIEKTLERVPDEPDRFRLVHAETLRPGMYEVRFHARAGGTGAGAGAGTGAGSERVEYFAVNVDPEEGDLARIDEAELRSLVPELQFRVEKERGAERLLRVADRRIEANELWRYALWAVLGLLPIESLVALRFGRRAAV